MNPSLISAHPVGALVAPDTNRTRSHAIGELAVGVAARPAASSASVRNISDRFHTLNLVRTSEPHAAAQ
jgi:hypothetical protein